MATFTKQTKNSTSFSNQAKTGKDESWDDADYSWDDAGQSKWDKQFSSFEKQTKNTATFNNQTKN